MGYLYLNFLENMNQGSKSWDDFYTSSLKEQYEVIKRKVGLNVSLQEFLSYAFPTQTSKNYYISMPSFDRRVKHDRRGKDVIYNIVIRPEKDSYLNNVVPNNYDLMIIGDVTFNNVIDITIKGIELIDINVAKFGEIKVALLDKSSLKYYSPLNVVMPCEQLGDTFEMQLLVERTADEEVLKSVLLKLYDIYHDETFSAEIGKAILFIVESLKDSSYFEKYSTNQLSKYNSVDEQIDLLLKMNSSFKGNSDWNEYFKTIGSNLITNSINEIRLDNMIYKNTVLTPLKNELKIGAQDYVKMFAEPVLSEDQDLVYQALETAGFETNQILGVVNVVEIYMDKILNDESISADTSLADKFRTVSSNLWNLNDMLGIESYSEYTLKEDFNVDEFFNTYSTLKTAIKSIEKYSKFAQDKYNNMNKYLEIYEPIHELLAIEREASSHPDKITKKYIDDYISKGRFKNAICELSVKLQYDLRELLKADDKTEAFELINMAEQEKLIDSKKCSSLHKLRKIRNGFQHPEKEQIQYTKADIEKWRDIVFEIGGSK